VNVLYFEFIAVVEYCLEGGVFINISTGKVSSSLTKGYDPVHIYTF